MNFGDRKMQMSSAAVPAMRTSPISAPSSASGDDLEADAARGLDEHGVARLEQARDERGGRGLRVGQRRSPAVAVGHVRGARADGDEHVDAGVAGVGADLRVEAGLVGPELEHVAEHGDAAAGRGRGEVVEGGAHRHRVGVVAVVDDDDAAGQLDPLAAQARQRDVHGPSGSTPDGPRGGQRGERVAAHVGAA